MNEKKRQLQRTRIREQRCTCGQARRDPPRDWKPEWCPLFWRRKRCGRCGDSIVVGVWEDEDEAA